MEFFPNAAPKHVESFKKLSQGGFYNGTLFHRIDKDFVIQGGDPNTRQNGTGREQRGTGGPGFSLAAEFNTIPPMNAESSQWHVQVIPIGPVLNSL
jgi:cyclophilin family peptidyl-prolyl cis-trans isomerase